MRSILVFGLSAFYLALGSTKVAHAHPGDHSRFDASGLLEHLLEPDHLVFIALIALVAVLAFGVGRRIEARQRRKP
jgi:hypothetical protein